MRTDFDADDLFDRGDDDVHVRVKDKSESFSTKTYNARNRFGQEMADPIHGGLVQTQSELHKAKTGVFFKQLARKHGAPPLTEWEKSLLDEMAAKDLWAGKIGSEWFDEIKSPGTVKALIDESGGSGGLEIAPIWFDADIYSVPLLTGELLPLVDLRDVPRGRRLEGASITHPTVSWGGIDDTAVSLFNTNSMIAAIDSTVFRCETSITVGRDLMDDSPVEIGNRVTQLIGERVSETLDAVIANGNGTTQPEGVFQKSGVTDINTDNGAGGGPTLNDYLTLLFTLAKQYRTRANRVVWITNDTTYQRSRSITVDQSGSDTDVRSVLDPNMINNGNTVNGYNTLGWQHRIYNSLSNQSAAICAMNRYRLYRRKGMEIRTSTEGDTLMRNNEMLIVMFARYAGQLFDAAAAATWSDGQS